MLILCIDMKKTIQLFAFILLSTTLAAQTQISGSIKDKSGEVLIGANIFIKDSYDGSSSDVDGVYSFETSQTGDVVLVVTYIGYEEQNTNISLTGDALQINIFLKESINKMEAVVISAGSFQGGTGTKSEVLKPLDIVTTAGATADISGALNTLPGTQTVGEEGRLFVRGGDGYETKTFIDGMQVLEPYSLSIPNTPTRGRFSPFMFSGTSFSTGGYSAEYGQALSSALVLDTKEKPTQTRTDLSLMSVGAELSHTQSWAKSSVAVQGAYYNMKPYFNLINQTTNWEKEPESGQVSFAGRKNIGNTGMLKLYSLFSSQHLVFYQNDILDPTVKYRIDLKNNYVYANTSIKNILSDSWSYQAGLSYTRNSTVIRLEDETIEESTKGGHFKYTVAGDLSSSVTLNTGAEILYSEGSQDYKRHSDGLANIVAYENPIISTFAELDIYISNNLLARVGGRLEYEATNKSVYAAPRISLAYKTSENSQIALAAGSFQQAPVDEFLRINNNLGFEKADHLILNYQLLTSNRTFRIEGYIKRYRDLVKFSPDDKFNPANYQNSGSGYARGIDVFWRDNMTIRNADYWVSYSYLDTERNYKDYPSRAIPSFASNHNLSVVYKHFVNSLKTQFSGTYTFASPRSYNNPNDSEFNGSVTPVYLDLSLSISYLAVQNVIIYASVTNVLGRENVFGYNYSNAPNDQGEFVGLPNKLPAPRFLFLGVFITFSKDSTLNQLKSL